jgi:hypothetical protein
MPDMTADETAEYGQTLAGLHGKGYRTVEEHDGLKAGTRIRRRGDQYPEAYRDGTGVVLVVTERSDSGWSQSYGTADVEMVVLYDQPRLVDSRLSQLAQYHVEAVEASDA